MLTHRKHPMAGKAPTAFSQDIRDTIVVNGKFAMRSERLRAAREGAVGRQVIAVEHLAERLAGGFLRMAGHRDLKATIAKVLPLTDLGELEPIKGLPGMVRASASTLMKFWLSDVDADELPKDSRLAAFMALQDAVTKALPSHLRRPQDLIQIASARAHLSKAIFGRIVFRGMTELHPVWRPLLSDIGQTCPIVWEAGPRPQKPSWIPLVAEVLHTEAETPVVTAETSATPRHEAVEAMRWARSLVVRGVSPRDIAIATVDTRTYDDHFVALKDESDLGLHIVHGIPAPHTKHGQQAAALADLLQRGLTQKRLRRLVGLLGSEEGAFAGLPENWTSFLKEDATLAAPELWAKALRRKPEAADAAGILLPAIEKLSGGIENAEEIGRTFLYGEALRVWTTALADGPAGALDRTLQSQREQDSEDPFSSVCYMQAEVLAACPRPYARLVGLSSRRWPRKRIEDALLPNRIIPDEHLDPMPAAEADRRDFWTVVDTSSKMVVLSWPRRDAEGKAVGVSSLVEEIDRRRSMDFEHKVVKRRRMAVPQHAFSEPDRVSARIGEFSATPRAVSATACWTDWNETFVTPHDGLISAAHPRIEAVFRQFQSATSIRTLLRDPLGFVWKYALGFGVPDSDDEPLLLDPRNFGNIVHDVLRRSVKAMKPMGGFASLPELRVAAAIATEATEAGSYYELNNPVPPRLVWQMTMEKAARFAEQALIGTAVPLDSQDSWVEAPFGGDGEWVPDGLPWDPRTEVRIPGSGLRLRGYIDRVDASRSRSSVRVVDYKSGKLPKKIEEMVIDGGRELQRCIYGYAIRSLLGGVEIESALVYPVGRVHAPLRDLDETLATVAAAVEIAKSGIDRGTALPGIAAKDQFNDLMFALPANATGRYLVKKNPAFLALLGEAASVWEMA